MPIPYVCQIFNDLVFVSIVLFSPFEKGEGVLDSEWAEGAGWLLSEGLVDDITNREPGRFRVIHHLEGRSKEVAVGVQDLLLAH